jgi:hypothetical protein
MDGRNDGQPEKKCDVNFRTMADEHGNLVLDARQRRARRIANRRQADKTLKRPRPSETETERRTQRQKKQKEKREVEKREL